MFLKEDLDLRKMSAFDLPRLLALKQESWQGTHQVAIINEQDQRTWYDSLDKHPHTPRDLILMAKETQREYKGHDVGVFKMKIDWVNRVADVAWDVFEDLRGKGYGKRLVKAGVAFCLEVLDLRRLSCEVLETNDRSLSCAYGCGFVTEGAKRKAVHKNGEYVDSYILGLLKSDVEKKKDYSLPLSNKPTEYQVMRLLEMMCGTWHRSHRLGDEFVRINCLGTYESCGATYNAALFSPKSAINILACNPELTKVEIMKDNYGIEHLNLSADKMEGVIDITSAEVKYERVRVT